MGQWICHRLNTCRQELTCFRDQEIGIDEAAETEGAPDEEDFGSQVTLVGVDHIGGNDTDDLISRQPRSVSVE